MDSGGKKERKRKLRKYKVVIPMLTLIADWLHLGDKPMILNSKIWYNPTFVKSPPWESADKIRPVNGMNGMHVWQSAL
jgi:hypothetical protein